MRYDGKIINKKTIENLKDLLSEEIQEDYRKATSVEEKEIIHALEILSYSTIDTEEEENKVKEDPSYVPQKEKTIGDISFGGTTNEILTNATTLRDILKNNSLINNAENLKTKTLYSEEDTFEFILENGQTLTFKKPVIIEDVADFEIPSMEEYLRHFYEKYNKENLKLYYESLKYKGETPRVPYPHELFVFEPGKKPRLRNKTKKNKYYEKITTLSEQKEKNTEDQKKKQENAKKFFSLKRDKLQQEKDKGKKGNKITNTVTSVKEGASQIKEIVKNRYKVLNKTHASNFFKKALYGLRAGAGSLTHKETWAALWRIIKPFAIAGVVTTVLGFTPVGSLLAKAILSCTKLVPLAFGNATKLIPYYLGNTTMSKAMVSACFLNLASLIAATGVTIWTIYLIVKALRKKGINVESSEAEKLEEVEETISEEKKEEETVQKGGYLRKISELKTQIKELETIKANLNDPTTKELNQETYFKILYKKLEEEKKKGNITKFEEEVKKLEQARTEGTLISNYNQEILEQIDKNIAILKENTDMLIEQYETAYFGGNDPLDKNIGARSLA